MVAGRNPPATSTGLGPPDPDPDRLAVAHGARGPVPDLRPVGTGPLDPTDRVSAATRSARSWTAAQTPSDTARFSTIRSETCSPASRRACWTTRSRSLTTPSATNSSASSVSSQTKPPPGARRPRRNRRRRPPVPGCTRRRPAPARRRSPRRRRPAVQSPDFAALITCWTSRPSRGPAALAFTVSRRLTRSSASARSATVTDATLTSSVSKDENGCSAAAFAVDTTMRCHRLPDPQAGCLAHRQRHGGHLPRPGPSPPPASASPAVPGSTASRSGAPTRPPVSPRHTVSVVSGSNGAATRHTVSSTVCRVSMASASPSQNRCRDRRTYQLVSTSR